MYLINTVAGLQAVFCDFSKGNDDMASIQTVIGTIAMKGKAIAFAANGNSNVDNGETVSFPNVQYGGSYFDGTNFEPPVSGYYTLTFSGESYDDASYIQVMDSGVATKTFYNHESQGQNAYRSFTKVFSMYLSEGDKISLQTNCDYGRTCLTNYRYLFGQLMS